LWGFFAFEVSWYSIGGLLQGQVYLERGVIENIKHQLAGWKMMYLSRRGSVTLIMSTPSNLPMYFMSLFLVPASGKVH
jgi:hypothetical protein